MVRRSSSRTRRLKYNSWDHTVLAELREKAVEHVLRIDAVAEAGAAHLYGAHDVVKLHEPENGVGERPRRHLCIGQRLQAVLADHRFPDRLLVGHVYGERRRNWVGGGHVEHRGDARPEVSPTENIPVG